MILCLRATNFRTLCDGIRGLLFFMLFEKPLILWMNMMGVLCCMVVHGSISNFGGSNWV